MLFSLQKLKDSTTSSVGKWIKEINSVLLCAKEKLWLLHLAITSNALMNPIVVIAQQYFNTLNCSKKKERVCGKYK